MFLEPEDNAVLFGWPWHGLIVDDVLTLGSGRTMPVDLYSNDTWLWDIGMPEPVVTPEDPDEQWLSKAIIRGVTSTSFYAGLGLTFGQAAFRSSPIYLEGERKTVDQQTILAENSLEPDVGVGVSVRVNGVTFTSNRLRWPDVGLPEKRGFLEGTFLDVGHDGARWLISISYGSTVCGYAEAAFSVVEGDLALVLTLLADNSAVAEWDTTLDEPYVVPLNMWLAEITGGEIVNAADNPGLSYYTPTGDYTAHAIASCVFGAWYGQDGTPALLRLHLDAYTDYSGTLGGTPYETGLEVHRGEIWLAVGGTETERVQFEVRKLIENITGVGAEVTVTYTLEDQVVVRTESFGSFQSIGRAIELDVDRHAWSGGAFSRPAELTQALHQFGKPAEPVPANLSIGAARPSNKICQPLGILTRLDATLYYLAGAALTPHGLDAGVVVYDTAAGPVPLNFIYGSYNPITGEVIRNQVEGHAYSWV
ncbi:hypothetical protein [Pseudomonas sp. ML96]|uniref:hypothetical protein n=1 Tax=Pseudomonas sp. ML96 TaxID=1523503 RepID=UPI0005BCED2C|nr:hypothetical protein [Pseudomonas sp. ML96]